MATEQFPLMSDGTVDWNFVFEDPAAGFVPDIQKSETPDALRRKAIHVAQTLHARSGDELRLKKLLSWIENIVPENADEIADLPKMKNSILKLVRDLKNERVSRADRYVEQQAAAGQAETIGDRRDSGKANGNPVAAQFPVKKSVYVLVAVAAALLLYLAYGG